MRKKKLNKIITVLTIISTLITIISASFKPLLLIYIHIKFKMDTRDASAVGIIGGADGPTAIFLGNKSGFLLFTIVFALLSISGIIYLIKEKHMAKKIII